MQRLGSDETLGRVIGSLESARLAAMALGSIGASALIELLGTRGAPDRARRAACRVFVIALLGPAARLRGRRPGRRGATTRCCAGTRSSRRCRSRPWSGSATTWSRSTAPAGEEVIVQGEHGDRFFLIEDGEVEVFENGVFRRNEGPGESFGEIALLHDVPRTATVRATAPTRLLALEREQFLGAVTGHRRSHQVAHTVVDSRWAPDAPELAGHSFSTTSTVPCICGWICSGR